MTEKTKEHKEDQMALKKEKPNASDQPKEQKAKAVKDKTIEIKNSEYQSFIKEATESKDKYMRLYAEFENARKRYDRERGEFVKYANEGLIAAFLSILDDLERSVDAANTKHEDYEAFLKGVKMVMAQIYEMLKKNGVKPMETAGKTFDPHCHEVLMQEETDQHEEGMVVEEFQKGYFLGDKVVRTAKVKVAVKKEKEIK